MRNRSIIAGCLLLVMAASSLAAPRSDRTVSASAIDEFHDSHAGAADTVIRGGSSLHDRVGE